MRPERVELGRIRGSNDGCRRYRPIQIRFNTRATVLDQVIGDDWEPEIQQQWRTMQAGVRMHLLAELGTVDGEAKIENHRAMGPAPWSFAYEHTTPLEQVRSAFAHGDFYPALVGACALGEQIFNHLILALRDDYLNHPATTKAVRARSMFTNWGAAIDVLHGWGILTEEVRDTYRRLKVQRDTSVHFEPTANADVRDAALSAIRDVQSIIEEIFAPMGGPPIYIGGTAGGAFIALDAEAAPLVRRIYLPRSALLSPAHRMYPEPGEGGTTWTIVDDADYDPTPLSDEEFAAALSNGVTSMHPEWSAPD